MIKLSLRGRLTVLSAGAVALAVAGASVGAWFAVRGQLRREVAGSLRNSPRAFAARLVPPPAAGSPAQTPGTAAQPRRLLIVSQVLDSTGAVVYRFPDDATQRLPVRPADIAVAQGHRATAERDDHLSDGTHVRVLTEHVGSQTVMVSRPLTEVDDTLSKLTLLLLVVSGLGIVGAGCLGLAVARAGLAPVDRLTETAEEIARTERLVPVPVRGADEIARLSRAFNTMTSALDRSRQQQRQLVLDAGHELRTPLTSLRTNIDLLVRSEQRPGRLSPQDRARLLEDLTAQTGELTALVAELVELTRGEPRDDAEVVDLAEVVGRAVERARLRAPEVSYALELASYPVSGSPAALERAVVNLLDNAAKFGPATQTVTVTLRAEGTLVVHDQGPGIAEEDLPHVLDRFYRAASSRSMPGSGLGLAIVAQAVQAHGGTIAVNNAPDGGALATVWLPPAGPTTTFPADPASPFADLERSKPRGGDTTELTPRRSLT